MTRVLTLVPRPANPAGDPLVAELDIYDLPDTPLDGVRGILVTGGCDQRLLATQREWLSDWVRGGGRLFVNGHPRERFVDGIPEIRKLEFHGVDDVWLTAMGEHPIWEGVDRRDVLFNTGLPGNHTFEKLREVGVAGFYAHAYLTTLPEGATVITGIGPGRLPVDVAWPLGAGEVMLHAGNDLMGFSRPGTSAARLGERMLDYLGDPRALDTPDATDAHNPQGGPR